MPTAATLTEGQKRFLLSLRSKARPKRLRALRVWLKYYWLRYVLRRQVMLFGVGKPYFKVIDLTGGV